MPNHFLSSVAVSSIDDFLVHNTEPYLRGLRLP